MKTNKIGVTIIGLLPVIVLLTACGDEQKEAKQQTEQSKAATESIPASPASQFADKAMDSIEKSGEAVKSYTDPMVEKTTEAIDSQVKPMTEKMTEAFDSQMESAAEKVTEAESMAEQVTEKTAEAVDTHLISPVKEAMSDAKAVVEVNPTLLRKIQQALLDAGFAPGAVDGMIGPKTMAALDSFQKQKGLTTGRITKETLRALGVSE